MLSLLRADNLLGARLPYAATWRFARLDFRSVEFCGYCAMPPPGDFLTFRFGDAGIIPNNPSLPVVVYLQVAPMGLVGAGLAQWFESEWPKHGWGAAWRFGVYPFPHYHSTAHEILGVYRGHATLRLGHTAGVTLEANAGDVLVLPAGTAHQNLGSTPDFHVVGGYPAGQQPDLLRGEASDRPAADARIAAVPLPSSDPLFGTAGPLVKEWNLA